VLQFPAAHPDLSERSESNGCSNYRNAIPRGVRSNIARNLRASYSR
jgi:hypothetical protein